MGLFADSEHSVMSATGPGEFSLYIWWLPGEGAFSGGRMDLMLPVNVQVLGSALNSSFHPLFGCYCPICFAGSCHIDWIWSQRIDFMILDATPSLIQAIPCEGYAAVSARTCFPGYPEEPAVVINMFGINQAPVISVDASSWGAIKSLCR